MLHMLKKVINGGWRETGWESWLRTGAILEDDRQDDDDDDDKW